MVGLVLNTAHDGLLFITPLLDFSSHSIIQHCDNWIGGFSYKTASAVYFAGKLETDNLQLASGKHISGVDGGVGGGMGVILGSSIGPTFSSFRMEGRVTTSCLWHACRAVTIGTLLIGLGITMIVLGEILKLLYTVVQLFKEINNSKLRLFIAKEESELSGLSLNTFFFK